MYKIKGIKFIGHPVLGDLDLDFTDGEGHAVDTVIIAGENGCGKSTVIGALYHLIASNGHRSDFEADVVYEDDSGADIRLRYRNEGTGAGRLLWVSDSDGFKDIVNNDTFRQLFPFSAIYSDVDINFHAKNVSSVTSLELDAKSESRRSTGGLPGEVKQLLVDIQDMDDASIASRYREIGDRGDSGFDSLASVEQRMPRFTGAFSRMFDDLCYDRIENCNGHKEIYFKKNGIDIPIDALSSGEKQIIYRGCFLLRDANAMTGAFVFIDEPEISLHPRWQMKVMDYYKSIFTNVDGVQTSQIFVVTHSPFVIHNETRCDDKVIVLERDAEGTICRSDKPTFYAYDSERAVESAFRIRSFSSMSPTAFLEGKTDEKYFRRAAEVFGKSLPFEFRQIGTMSASGDIVGGGAGSLSKAARSLSTMGLNAKFAFVFDCDVSDSEFPKKANGDKILAIRLDRHKNAKSIVDGIENSLVLDDVDVSRFFTVKESVNGYGGKRTEEVLDKDALCNHVYSLDDGALRSIFANLFPVIEELRGFFAGQ